MRMKETKETPAEKAVYRSLGRFIKLLAAPECEVTKKQIAETLSRKAKLPVTRQMVSRWLHPDPTKRSQALHGTGILLVEVLEELTA